MLKTGIILFYCIIVIISTLVCSIACFTIYYFVALASYLSTISLTSSQEIAYFHTAINWIIQSSRGWEGDNQKSEMKGPHYSTQLLHIITAVIHVRPTSMMQLFFFFFQVLFNFCSTIFTSLFLSFLLLSLIAVVFGTTFCFSPLPLTVLAMTINLSLTFSQVN